MDTSTTETSIEEGTEPTSGGGQATATSRPTEPAPTTSRSDDAQLRLLPPNEGATWRLSGTTREIGRRGVAEARAALQAARRHGERPDRSAAA
jgi:hypothetical protein